MSCYHPLTAIVLGKKDNGKNIIKVVSKESTYDIRNIKDTEIISIPCGHCIGCLLDRSRQWADRCMLEASYHEKNCFITLTIDDDHLFCNEPIYHDDLVWYPIENKNYDMNHNEIDRKYVSLRKRDFQLFMKRLRKDLDKDGIKIRYFGCSEYGSKSFRPHYHAIIFGYDFSDDRVLHKQNFAGDKLFISNRLCKLWPFGFSTVADCTWNTCAYVARYCLKKRDNNLDVFYDLCECEHESIFMSRRPGIARRYYDDHCTDIYSTETILLADAKGSRKLKPPRYFDKLYDVDYPSDMQRIKDRRKANFVMNIEQISEKTDKNYFDYLKVKEYNHINKTKILNERSVGI